MRCVPRKSRRGNHGRWIGGIFWCFHAHDTSVFKGLHALLQRGGQDLRSTFVPFPPTLEFSLFFFLSFRDLLFKIFSIESHDECNDGDRIEARQGRLKI